MTERRDRHGFRLRGLEMTRIETFTDAAFAFVVTLLVVSVDAIPTNHAELILAIKGIPAFGLSFLLIMMFWYGHWTWSRRFGLEDKTSILLSCLLVFTVLCYVYPLKYLFTIMMAWFSRGFFPGTPPSFTGQQLYDSFAIYGAGFTAMCLCIALLNVHAYRLREEIELDEKERFDTRAEFTAWLIVAGVGVLSMLIALLTPPHRLGLPGWTYMLLPILMPTYAVISGRRWRRREAG